MCFVVNVFIVVILSVIVLCVCVGHVTLDYISNRTVV